MKKFEDNRNINIENNEFLYDLIIKELNYQNQRKEIIDSKTGYLLTLIVGILTFIGAYMKWPEFEKIEQLSSKFYCGLYFSMCLGVLILIVSLIIFLFVILPNKYSYIDVADFIDKLEGRNIDKKVLLPLVSKNKTVVLKENEKVNDDRFFLMKIGILVLIIGFLLVIVPNMIITNAIL